MQMHQIRYFLALCDERNFTRAAKRCGVTQPSLTRAIKLLEEELGSSLYDRANNRMTDLGIILRSDLALIDRSAAEIKRKAAKRLTTRSPRRQSRASEAFMKIHHVMAVVAVLVIGVGAKQFLFPPKEAEADVSGVGINPHQMTIEHPNRNNHPVQKMHDMTFVYSDGDVKE